MLRVRPVLLSQSYRNAMLNTPGLIGYWRLSEASGTVASDQCGKNDGTYVGTPTLGVAGALSGDPNTAITVNGSTQWVDAPSVNFVSYPRISLVIWTKNAGAESDVGLIGQGNAGSGAFMEMYAGLVYFFTNSTPITATHPTDGLWHHYVATADGSNSRIYIDGVLAAGPTATSDVQANALPFQIGTFSNSGGGKYSGSLDEAAWFGCPLAAAQIARFYRLGRGF